MGTGGGTLVPFSGPHAELPRALTGPSLDQKYYILDVALHRVGESYQVELAHTDPGSQAQVAPLRAPTPLDPEALLALQGVAHPSMPAVRGPG